MGPKIEAACDFVTRTGKTAAIGALEDAVRIIDGKAAGCDFYLEPQSLWGQESPAGEKLRQVGGLMTLSIACFAFAQGFLQIIESTTQSPESFFTR